MEEARLCLLRGLLRSFRARRKKRGSSETGRLKYANLLLFSRFTVMPLGNQSDLRMMRLAGENPICMAEWRHDRVSGRSRRVL